MGCYSSAVINAPAEEVWNVLKNFHDLSWSQNVITKVDAIGDKKSNEVGAKRILNDAFHETLLSLKEKSMQFTYSIDDGPAAVSKENVDGYVGKVKVYPITENNTSFVKWTSKWKSTEEGGIEDFCNPIYHAALQDLKSHFS